MPSFKFSLFDDDDWKKLEDTLMRAMVRAARIIAKENLIQGYRPPQESPVVETPDSTAPTEIFKSPSPLPAAPIPLPVPMPRHEEIKQRKARRSLNKICKTVETRPQGYITSEDAAKLMGGSQADKTYIHQWVMNGEIPGVLVRSIKPPTKGCHGRLTVDKEKLVARNKQRVENFATLPQFSSKRKAA
jgi:hypothetical protein